MKAAFTTSRPLIPQYRNNAALQLVLANGVGFIMFHFVRVFLLTMGTDKEVVANMTFPNIGLSTVEMFREKWWTILTYGWVHHGFFDWFTNMIWLYVFGSVLQNLAGFRQLIPLFVYSLLAGGAFFLGAEILFPEVRHTGSVFLGAQAGVLALGIAALTLVPSYKLHFSETFRVPLALIVGIYIVLDLIVYLPDQWNVLSLCLGGAVTGFTYAILIKNGFRPGEWVYAALGKAHNFTTPDEAAIHEKKSRKRMEVLRQMYEPKKGISQQRIDEILDKINEKGVHSLSSEEKDTLLRAGKDNE